MRILIVHNYLRAPSGENTVFEQEKALLESKGHDVITYTRKNEEINEWGLTDRVALPFNLIWSRRSCHIIKNIIKEFKPAIAHFHNIFPLISPAVYHACQHMGIPVVQTLHHFRLVCPGALLFRNGQICEECAGLKFRSAIRHACYRNSRFQTAGMALMIYLHYLLKTWHNEVDTYIALSDFAKDKFQELKFPSDRFCIKPNFLQEPVEPSFAHQGYGIFIGRLGEEKGLGCLLEAMRNCPEIQLKIIGDGPIKEFVLSKLRDSSLDNVEYIGLVDHDHAMEYLRNSQFMVFPSICYEGMPMVILEALAAAKPVIASRIGILPEIIEDGISGLICEAGSISDLTEKLKWLNNRPIEALEMGKRGRKAFEEKYTADKNYELLMDIYQKAIEINRKQHGR